MLALVYLQNRTTRSGYAFEVNGDALFSGSVVVSGTLVANEYNVNVIDKTVTRIFSTGSTDFGNSEDDTHTFSGHLSASGPAVFGSVTVSGEGHSTGNLLVSGSTTLGAAATDVTTVTGPLTGSQGGYFAKKVGINIAPDSSADYMLEVKSARNQLKLWENSTDNAAFDHRSGRLQISSDGGGDKIHLQGTAVGIQDGNAAINSFSTATNMKAYLHVSGTNEGTVGHPLVIVDSFLAGRIFEISGSSLDAGFGKAMLKSLAL